MKSSTNKFPVVLLLIGIAICIALLPWGRWFDKSPDEKLSERLAQYVQLRLQDDWVAIYGLIDAEDRRVVPIQRYLQLYGSGAIKTLALTETKREIDLATGTAHVELALDGELRLDRLPASTRASLRLDDKTATRQSGPCPLKWNLRDGAWWLRMDNQAITSRAEDGRQIQPTGG